MKATLVLSCCAMLGMVPGPAASAETGDGTDPAAQVNDQPPAERKGDGDEEPECE